MRKYTWYKKKYRNKYRKDKFTVSIYLNGKEYKKLYERKFLNSALNMFNKELEKSENIFFPVRFGSHLKPEMFEIVIIGNTGSGLKYHPNEIYKVELPTLKDDGFVIKRIKPINVEEKFIRYGKKAKINFKKFINIIIKHKHKSLTVYQFKNKIYVEDFDLTFHELFIFKNEFDRKRFIHIFKRFLTTNEIYDIIIMLDADNTPDRTILYDKIMENINVSREFLIRPYTH